MMFQHLKPGNVTLWQEKHWIILETTKRSVKMVSFTDSTNIRTLNSSVEFPPRLIAQNAADFVIDLVSNN